MRRHYRSFFWPVVLIVIGVLALLVDINVVSADRLYRLADLWPLILIVIGLELIARRTLQGAAVDIAAVLILVIAGVGAIAYVSVGPAIPGGLHTLDRADPIGTLKTASLEVDVGAANLTVQSSSSIGTDLYRAHIEYQGPTPSVTLDPSTGELRISQDGGFLTFGNRRFVVDLQVNPTATWSFTVNSGAANDTFKLTSVNVGSIEINAAASQEDITLGLPNAKVPIRINGASVTVHVHRPKGTEASVQVSGAAVSLTADGESTRGIGSKSWQTPGYDGATDAYSIEVDAAASNVVVDANGPILSAG